MYTFQCVGQAGYCIGIRTSRVVVVAWGRTFPTANQLVSRTHSALESTGFQQIQKMNAAGWVDRGLVGVATRPASTTMTSSAVQVGFEISTQVYNTLYCMIEELRRVRIKKNSPCFSISMKF